WSERAVKPTRSQNNTVTTLRSSSVGRCAAASGAPHAPQNRKPWGLSCPHLEQLAIPAVYGEAPKPRAPGHQRDRHCPPATSPRRLRAHADLRQPAAHLEAATSPAALPPAASRPPRDRARRAGHRPLGGRGLALASGHTLGVAGQ